MRGLLFSKLHLKGVNHVYGLCLARRQRTFFSFLHHDQYAKRSDFVHNLITGVRSGSFLPSQVMFRMRTLTRLGVRPMLRFKFAQLHQAKRIPQTLGLLAFLSGSCLLNHLKHTTSRAACQSVQASEIEQLPASENCHTIQVQFTILQQIHLALRLVYLAVIFSPVIVIQCLSYLFGSPYLENLGWKYMLVAIQLAGPAFMKLGQWASTRRDIFCDKFCNTLSQLHTRCDAHSWNETVQFLEENFGEQWEEQLVIEDHTPIGSGCVAQVYKGCLVSEVRESHKHHLGGNTNRTWTGSSVATGKEQDGTQLPLDIASFTSTGGRSFIPIAVKVIHPGVVEAMEMDITLMKYVASWVDYIYPKVHWIALKECVDQFSVVMNKQLDLQLEAENLRKFQKLLRSYDNVKFPTPIYPFVTTSVLVESFEQGTLISNFLDNPGGALQKQLARVGIEVLLDMVFIHNLVHGDLHPGNILVQNDGRGGNKLVLLDCGIATSLKRKDLENIKAVFTAIVNGEGKKVADLLLGAQHCITVEEYREKMAELVETGRRHLNLKETRVGTLFADLFNILIEHKVRIEPNYTSVMVAMMVIEGLGRSLDPTLDILRAARSCLLQAGKKSLRKLTYMT